MVRVLAFMVAFGLFFSQTAFSGTAVSVIQVKVNIVQAYNQFKNSYNSTLSEIKKEIGTIDRMAQSSPRQQAVNRYMSLEEKLYKRKVNISKKYERFIQTVSRYLNQKKADNELKKMIEEELSENHRNLESVFDQLIRYANLKQELLELVEKGKIENGEIIFTDQKDVDRYNSLVREIDATIGKIEQYSKEFSRYNQKILNQITRLDNE
ncbi:hypothetical protein [Persephonella sp.]|nr:hypothetical protein [Aquificota bacterium]